MVEKELQDRLKRIFQVSKVTMDAPGFAPEQETLYVNIETAKVRTIEGLIKFDVRGTLSIVGPSDKIPLGYLSRKLLQAPHALTKGLALYDLETNSKRGNNLVERGSSFIYFFSTQYDPDLGSITAIDLIGQEEQN